MTAREAAERAMAELGATGLCDRIECEPTSTDAMRLTIHATGHRGPTHIVVLDNGRSMLCNARNGACILTFATHRLAAVLERYLALRDACREAE